jgi:hypothetical protein
MKSEDDPLTTAVLNLPVYDLPQNNSRPAKMTWEEVMDQTELQREFYMKHFDSPDKRLQNKNPAPFRLSDPETGEPR